jgi:hypothetical protein
MHVTLLGRRNCHLCDDATEALGTLADRFELTTTTIDIDEYDHLVKEYGLRIPVIVGDDGRVLAEGLITVEHLVTVFGAGAS